MIHQQIDLVTRERRCPLQGERQWRGGRLFPCPKIPHVVDHVLLYRIQIVLDRREIVVLLFQALDQMTDRRHSELAFHFLLFIATLLVQPRDIFKKLGELFLQLSDNLLFMPSFLR